MFLFNKKNKPDKDALRIVFDEQLKNLIEKNYYEVANISLEDFKNQFELLWKSLEKNLVDIEFTFQGKIPLLLVTPQGDISEKLKKINGHTNLDLFNMAENEIQNMQSILLDVEDGTKMMAKSPKDSLRQFKKENRHALTLNEGVALLTHYSEVLKNHYVISAGTFYNKDNEKLPLLWLLDEDNNPELHYAWFDIAHGNYGAASYAIKIHPIK